MIEQRTRKVTTMEQMQHKFKNWKEVPNNKTYATKVCDLKKRQYATCDGTSAIVVERPPFLHYFTNKKMHIQAQTQASVKKKNKKKHKKNTF